MPAIGCGTQNVTNKGVSTPDQPKDISKVKVTGCGTQNVTNKGVARQDGPEDSTKVPAIGCGTENSELARLLQQEDDYFRKGTSLKRIKMVERGGKSMKDILCKKNPWADEGCTRIDCLPCRGESGRGADGQKESVVYSMVYRLRKRTPPYGSTYLPGMQDKRKVG